MAKSDIRLEITEGLTVRFANANEFREFLGNERAFYANLRFNQDSPHIHPDVRNAARLLENAQQNAGEERSSDEQANARDLAEAFLKGTWPHAHTPERQLLNSLDGLRPSGSYSDKETMMAAFQLLYGSGEAGQSVTPIAAAIASFAVSSLSFGAAHTGKPLYREHAKAQQAENRRVLGQLEADVLDARANLEERQTELIQRTDYLFGRARKRFETFRRLRRRAARATQEELARLHLTYREQMRLQEPVKYWSDKEIAHNRSARQWFLAAIGAAIAVLIVPIGLWWSTTGQSSDAPQLSILFRAAQPSWPAIIREAKGLTLVLLASGLTVWALRFSARVYLSERHLATDARERQTIVMTYLALLKESAATEAERTIVLQTLFRSSADGIVKDDSGMDPSIAGLLGKVVERFKP